MCRAFIPGLSYRRIKVSEKSERTEEKEIESLNENTLDPQQVSDEDLEEVSGGLMAGSCGTNSCGTFT